MSKKFASLHDKSHDITDMYTQMFGRDVVFKPERRGKSILKTDFIVATFKNSEEQLMGALVFDIPLASSLCMAFTEMAPEFAQTLSKSNRFTQDLWENLHEVSNISCGIFSLRKEQTVHLSQVIQSASLPASLKEALNNTEGDYFTVDVQDYGMGSCLIIQALDDVVVPEVQPTLFDSFEEPIQKETKKEEPPTTPKESVTPTQKKKKGSSQKPTLSPLPFVVMAIIIAAALFFLFR